MPLFTYKAKDRQGQLINGSLEADSRAAVTSRLQSMGYFPMSISGGPTAGEGTNLAARKKATAGAKKIKAKHLTAFFRQMSDLVGAGVPLVKSLGIVKSQSADPALSTLLAQVDRDVQGGDTFAKALEKHPKSFTKLSTAMIHAGETGGLLDEVLARLADFAEAEEELRGKIKSALAYPAVMVMAGIGAIAILMTFVIPKIIGVFKELNQDLPEITKLLIFITHIAGAYWYWVIGIGVAIGWAVRSYYRTPAGAMLIDRIFLMAPVLGDVVLKREIARFTRTFGALLRNGVPILGALEIASEVLTNKVILHDVADIPEGIAQGRGIAGTLRGSHYFPPVVINMISIGEETGNLPGVLLKVATAYESQVDRAVKTLTSIIEPLIILALGVVVGFIVIAMLLPIFQLDPSGG